MKLDVLLTDGDYKNTYAILRALKSKGLRVGILIHKYSSITYFSRLVDKRFIIKSNLVKNPSPNIFSNYFNEIKEILKKNEIAVFLPVSNVSYKFAALYKKEIEKYCKVPVVDNETMNIAQDKSITFEHAEKNGIPIPKTFRFNTEEDIYKKIESIKFPCVLKKTNYNESGVVYCNDEKELINAFKKIIINKKKEQQLSGYSRIYNRTRYRILWHIQ